MRIHIDPDKCVGSGNCVLTASEVFDQADDGTVELLNADPPAAHHRSVREAAALCPVGAISVDEQE
jgi:ferredoxin